MIRERYLTPGRVLEHRVEREVQVRDAHGWHIRRDTAVSWERCMVISYVPFRTGRRHSNSKVAPTGWRVLVMWMDDRQEMLEGVTIIEGADAAWWRLLW